jgi:hypothetical protein
VIVQGGLSPNRKLSIDQHWEMANLRADVVAAWKRGEGIYARRGLAGWEVEEGYGIAENCEREFGRG